MQRRIRAAATAMLLAWGSGGGSAIAASDFMDRVQERANLRSEMLRLITGEDTELALAAFEEAVQGADPELRLSVMEAAITSDRPRLRKAALRQFLNERPEMLLQVVLPERPEKGQELLFDLYNGYVFRSMKVDSRTDIITFDPRTVGGWSGQLVEDGFDLGMRDGSGSNGMTCVAKVRIATGIQMTGELNCVLTGRRVLDRAEGASRVVVPLSIRLA